MRFYISATRQITCVIMGFYNISIGVWWYRSMSFHNFHNCHIFYRFSSSFFAVSRETSGLVIVSLRFRHTREKPGSFMDQPIASYQVFFCLSSNQLRMLFPTEDNNLIQEYQVSVFLIIFSEGGRPAGFDSKSRQTKFRIDYIALLYTFLQSWDRNSSNRYSK